MSAKRSSSSSGRCLQVRSQSRDQAGVAGDGSRWQGGSKSRLQGGSAPHQKGHHHMYEFANHPADEPADEFGSRKSLFLWGRAGHPAPRRGGRDRGRGCPRPLAPNDLIEGSGVASKLGPRGGGRGGQFGRRVRREIGGSEVK